MEIRTVLFVDDDEAMLRSIERSLWMSYTLNYLPRAGKKHLKFYRKKKYM